MKNFFVTLGCAGALASCGYTPLYAPAGRALDFPVEVREVTVSNPQMMVGERRTAQRIRQRLAQTFPMTGADMDTLRVVVREETSELAVQRNATITRAALNLIGNVELKAPDGTLKLRTDLTTSAPYNVENTPFSTESGRGYARQTAATNMADEISRLLTIYYRQHGAPAAPAR